MKLTLNLLTIDTENTLDLSFISFQLKNAPRSLFRILHIRKSVFLVQILWIFKWENVFTETQRREFDR